MIRLDNMQKETKNHMQTNGELKKNGVPQKSKKKVLVYTKKKKAGIPEIQLIKEMQQKYDSIDLSTVTSFDDFPLSQQTRKGLKNGGYNKPTEIQLKTLKQSLKGSDILGAAQTGSGKTLAFLIPLLEVLYCNQWSRTDGVGALVITPTRELAYQIFEELKKIGEQHDFSAGLIIGGKDLKIEKERMDQCNIIICTPGRLLQHMDQNPLFTCDNMKILVLDEADRILDMGFAETMNAIIENLPPVRQSLLFSATQTKSVKDLARLSLHDACYVSAHANKEFTTPSALQQNYMLCELHAKVSVLYSFIKNHQKCKIIIFFTTCQQTKYFYNTFCKLRPGLSLLALHGGIHQQKRMNTYQQFCYKTHAVLLATDLASRGLDFPRVDWVVQADCPEDVEAYIHRVGRTARYHRGGESLLLLLPSERAMVEELEKHKIPIEPIDINPDRLTNPVRKLEAYLARDLKLKESAQRAVKVYFKAVALMKNKKVFNVKDMDAVQFAHSLGLAIAPRIRFVERMLRKDGLEVNTGDSPPKAPNKSWKFESDDEDSTFAPESANNEADADKSDEDLLQIKRADHDIDEPIDMEKDTTKPIKKNKPLTKVAQVKKMLKKNIVSNKRTVFDDNGEVLIDGTKQKQSELAQEYENENEGGINIEQAKLVLKEEDQYDKQLFKEKMKAKKKEAKRKLKEKKNSSKINEGDHVDDFGSDDESGSEPDLSWMPDPDSIYGPKGDDSDMEKFNSEDEIWKSDDDEEEATPSKTMKRKLSNSVEKQTSAQKKCSPKKKVKLEDVSSLNVNDAEELAMMLLRK